MQSEVQIVFAHRHVAGANFEGLSRLHSDVVFPRHAERSGRNLSQSIHGQRKAAHRCGTIHVAAGQSMDLVRRPIAFSLSVDQEKVDTLKIIDPLRQNITNFLASDTLNLLHSVEPTKRLSDLKKAYDEAIEG